MNGNELDVRYRTETRRALWIALVYIIVFQLVAGLLCELMGIKDPSASGLPYFVAVFFGLVLIWAATSKKDMHAILDRKTPNPTVRMFLGWVAIMLLVQMFSGLWDTIVENLVNIFGYSATSQVANASVGNKESLSIIIYTCIVSPLTEEFVFRGYLLHYFGKYSKKLGIVVTAVMFGVYHMNIVQTPYAFVLGLLLGYVASEYGLKWSFALHFTNNAIIGELLQLVVRHLPKNIGGPLSGMIVIVGAIAGLYLLFRYRKQIEAWVQNHTIPFNYLRWGLINVPAVLSYLLCIVAALTALDKR